MFGKKNANAFENWDEYSRYLEVAEKLDNFPEEEKYDAEGNKTKKWIEAQEEFDKWSEKKNAWYDLYIKQIEAEKSEKTWPKILCAVLTMGGAIGGPLLSANYRWKMEQKGEFNKTELEEVQSMAKEASRNAWKGR